MNHLDFKIFIGQHYKRIVLFSKMIDDMFGAKKDKHSVKCRYITNVFLV